jgi:hypothetical protein
MMSSGMQIRNGERGGRCEDRRIGREPREQIQGSASAINICIRDTFSNGKGGNGLGIPIEDDSNQMYSFADEPITAHGSSEAFAEQSILSQMMGTSLLPERRARRARLDALGAPRTCTTGLNPPYTHNRRHLRRGGRAPRAGMKRRTTANAFETQGMVRGQEQAQRLRADPSPSHHSDMALRLSTVPTVLT